MENKTTLKIFLFTFLLFSSFILGQKKHVLSDKLEYGILAEMTSLKSENIENNWRNRVKDSFFPISIYLSTRYKFAEHFSAELRPGILVGNDYYQGFELGFFFRYKLDLLKLYFIGGINFHNNFTTSLKYKDWIELNDDIASLLNLSVGFYLRDNFGILISFYQPVNSYYIYSYHDNYFYDELLSSDYKVKLKNIIKIGFDYTF